MGIDSGSNPEEAAAAKAHAEKMALRQQTIDAKTTGIAGNPGETRDAAAIRAQAEEETDSNISV